MTLGENIHARRRADLCTCVGVIYNLYTHKTTFTHTNGQTDYDFTL